MANFPSRNGMSQLARARSAAHPAAAGFRPSGAVLALAAVFGLHATPTVAQPSGGVAIHGSASFATSGKRFTVTTVNGVGTNHSAIDWQSFSVPAGTTTQFLQPGTTSTSINRVVTSNPSAIFGTLSSNGRLVLVNPAGITVGAGAVVDTAGFTASTLGMSDADAVAGLLRFGGGGAPLKVEGGATIRAQGGDVVLIAPQVQTAADALVQSDGATLLLAGQKVEITGRGLEGIRMEVQAGNEAVNLGTLKGDAVGIFAGTLRHSGLVQAQSASLEGGKVVLKATGDATVDGAVRAQAGTKGGSVDVLGQGVSLLAGAAIDASGANGGGRVRIGGDYQGGNAAVPNAAHTSVDAQAVIRADATAQGDGGRVIVWADEGTRMDGSISARGGAQGGNGGFAEVSGRHALDFTGSADLRSPRGRVGTLLLDPADVRIGLDTASNVLTQVLEAQLERSEVQIRSAGLSTALGRITVASDIVWHSGNALVLDSASGITLQGNVRATDLATGAPNGLLHLLAAGDIVQAPGSVVQVDQLLVQSGGRVGLTNANLVNTLAGRSGSGADFAFTNAQALTVGVVTPPGDSPESGVNNTSLVHGATTITTTAGALNVRAAVLGSTVGLTASAGDIDVFNTRVEAESGKLSVDAAGALRVGVAPTPASETAPFTRLRGHGGVGIHAGGSLLAGGGSSVVAFNGEDGGVEIHGGADISLTGTQVTTSRTPIELTAAGSILGDALFVTDGGGAGVSLTATAGSISFGEIRTFRSSEGTAGSVGGKVELSAHGEIAGDAIDTRGASHDTTETGNGGNVEATSTAGDIRIGSFVTLGGDGLAAAGGRGGDVTLTANGGSITAQGVLANGGRGDGFAGGSGGTIDFVAGGTIDMSVGGLQSNGGDGAPAGAGGHASLTAGGDIDLLFAQLHGGRNNLAKPLTGGVGGTVEITSTDGDVVVGAIDAGGGDAASGPAGDGGSITLRAPASGASGGNVQVLFGLSVQGGSPVAGNVGAAGGAGGQVTVTADKDIVVGLNDPEVPASFLGLIAAGGGSGSAPTSLAAAGNGGKGGSVTLQAGGRVAVGLIEADGGVGQVAGDGGSVTLSGDTLQALDVQALGGQGAPALGTIPAGTGGGGGTIDLTLTGATGVFDGMPVVRADGGAGGSITVHGQSLTVGAASGIVLSAAGEDGGAPGHILVTANDTTLGNVTFAGDTRVEATAGQVRTTAATTQQWSGGHGLQFDGSAGITLAGALEANAGPGSSLGLHAARGDIVQSDGSLHADALVALADAGAVDLSHAVQVASVSGGAGTGFQLVNGSDLLGIEGTGIHAGNVTVRTAGSLRVTSTVAAAHDVHLEALSGSGTALSLAGATLQAGGSIDVLGRTSDASGFGVDLTGDVAIHSGVRARISGENVADSGWAGAGVGVHSAIIDQAGALEMNGASTGPVGLDIADTQLASLGGRLALDSLQTVRIAHSQLETGGGALRIAGGSSTHAGTGVLVTGGSSLHAGSGAVDVRGSSQDATGFQLESVAGGLTVSGSDVNVVGSTVSGGVALLVDAERVTSTISLKLQAVGGSLQIQRGSIVSNSGTGPLLLQSTGGPDGPSLVAVSADSSVASGGDLQVIADRIQLAGTLASATGRTLIQPLDTSRAIQINGVDNGDSLFLTQADLDRMTGNTLVIGDASLTGGIRIAGATTIRSGASLSLRTGGAIGQDGGALLTATNLNADGASVLLDEVAIGSGTGGILSGRATGGDFRIVNAQSAPAVLRIGSIAGTDGVSATGAVTITTPGLLRLSQAVHSDAAGNAITLAAGDLARDGAGALQAGAGRWLVYLPGTSANLASGPASGKLALWGRDFAADPPEAVTETGNRYLFATVPVVDVAATAVTKVYDANAGFGALGFSAPGLVDAAQFGNVFLQDAFTGALAVPTATKNVGSYAITQGALQAPAGYRFGTFTPASASITPAPLTIAAHDLAKDQGAALTFAGTEFTAQGLVGGEKIASVTLASPGAPASAAAGSYAITPAGAAGSGGFVEGNYRIAYVDGVLKVAGAAASPAPAPAPAPALTPAAVQVNNQVVTFSSRFVEDAGTQPSAGATGGNGKKDKDKAKDDVVVTDSACKR